VSADRQSPCQGVANAKTVQLGGAFDRRVSYARRYEAKHLFQVHKVHMATRDLSIRQVHGGPRVHPRASSTAGVIAPSRATICGGIVAVREPGVVPLLDGGDENNPPSPASHKVIWIVSPSDTLSTNDGSGTQ